MKEYLKDVDLLYAEDEQDVQSNMKEYFESYFKNVYVASDGMEAFKIYLKHKPEVVILDINMPHKNGLEVARNIRESDKNTRIIMLSAHSEKNLLLEATEIDMSKYVIKPIDPYEFKFLLSKVAKELMELSSSIIKLDNTVWFCKDNKVLTKDSVEIELSIKEQKLLSLLSKNIESCVSFEEIMVNVWDNGAYEEVSKDSVKSQVNNLRKKLPENSISNIYGKGYCLHIKI